MKWRKLGKIFDPSEYYRDKGYLGFAQSPQALVFDDFIRVFFSVRKKDREGMYLSHVAFADFDKTLQKVIRVSSEPVIQLGDKGTFDEHGIFPFSPFVYKDKIMAYTCGWSRRIAVPVETSTGLAFSEDKGSTFKKYATGPVLTSSLLEPFLVGDSFVRHYDGRFHMWYIYGCRWINATGSEPVARVYKIGHAVSEDGIGWEKEGRAIIKDRLEDDECQALPTVAAFDDKYHMFFCYRYATGFRNDKKRGYRLGYAYSSDLTNWTRDDEGGGLNETGKGWDSDMMCYPNIFKVDETVYVLYNGNEFGRHGFGAAILEKE